MYYVMYALVLYILFMKCILVYYIRARNELLNYITSRVYYY